MPKSLATNFISPQPTQRAPYVKSGEECGAVLGIATKGRGANAEAALIFKPQNAASGRGAKSDFCKQLAASYKYRDDEGNRQIPLSTLNSLVY